MTIEAGIIMLGHRVVIPNKFKEQLLQELHAAHAGVVKMKTSNGAAENLVKSVKLGLQKAFNDVNNADVSLNCILARYLLDYRSSVHCTTNKTPAEEKIVIIILFVKEES
ncbi:hypothetical protein QE152_g26371 [Popillia japonica]|uniref:Uncharacterized protein n=1 Tax=Popillia japonica TaxID=7064 RepID=A0AAW1JYR9_POPJA